MLSKIPYKSSIEEIRKYEFRNNKVMIAFCVIITVIFIYNIPSAIEMFFGNPILVSFTTTYVVWMFYLIYKAST